MSPDPIPNLPVPDPGSDRRGGPDRRQTVVDRRHLPTGLERRRGAGRRRNDFVRAADEGQLNSEQFLFVMAIDAYKRANSRPYPTWTEVLEVIRKLGYRKTCPSGLNLSSAEDWTEAGDAPAFAGSAPVEIEESHEGA